MNSETAGDARSAGRRCRQPVNARGLGRWRRYATQLKPLIDSLSENGVVLS